METNYRSWKRENGEEKVHVVKLSRNDCTHTAVDSVHKIRVQNMLSMSLEVTLDKIKDTSGR